MATVTIRGKSLGARKPLFSDWSIPFPPEWAGEGGITLRDLIARVVRAEVQAFRQRQEDRQFIRALTERDIAAGRERGKIDSGGSETLVQPVDEEQSVAAACQAFEDGLYLVVIDGVNCRKLEEQVYLAENSLVTFVRLTLLAGG